MPPLPSELTDEVIDRIAERSPEWLPSCALVSHTWKTRSIYHIRRIFRTPTVMTFDSLHAFMDIIRKHPRLAALATTLNVVPDPDSASTSYVPFHHLSSRVLPNVRHLVLGETLRWDEYPLLYRKGTVACFFHGVTTLDISSCFGSVSDLVSTIRSFRNVRAVRLVYPHHTFPRWMFNKRRIPFRHGASRRETFKLHSLELSVSIVHLKLHSRGVPNSVLKSFS